MPDNITYREHFSQWYAKLFHLQVPHISEEEIVINIASHYPGYIRAILLSLPDKSVIVEVKVLNTEEHRREKTETPSVENNFNNQHTQHKWNSKGPQKDNNQQYQRTPNNS